ncbi:MAG: amino acid ABC transporter permease [Lachnospiraceae bacterium]|nr:amino acid ABC transporter permease [Lachnospiraceae bacterium]
MNLDTKFMLETFIDVLGGVPVTLKITIVTLLVSTPAGFMMALSRAGKGRIGRRIIIAYVSLIRGTPVVLQILFLYSLLPTLLNYLIKEVLGLEYNIFRVDPILYAYIVFILNTTAVLSEVFRSALSTVNQGQMEAALSIGMTKTQAYIRIIVPQALVAALPNICNTTVNLLKSTSLAFMMTVRDITAIAKIDASFGYNYLEAYLVIFVAYVLLCSAVQGIFRLAERSASSYRNGKSRQKTPVMQSC